MAFKSKDSRTQARIDALSGYSPIWVTLICGYVAAGIVFFLPALLIVANLGVQELIGLFQGPGGVGYGIQNSDLMLHHYASGIAPWTGLGALVGCVLSLLRRYSIQQDRFFRFAMTDSEMRFGYQSIFMMIAGPIGLVVILNLTGYAALTIWINFGIVFTGLAFDAVWEPLQDRLLSVIVRRNHSMERALEIRDLLHIDEDLGRFWPTRVAVDWENRTAHVEGEYDEALMAKRVRDVVKRRITGINTVEVSTVRDKQFDFPPHRTVLIRSKLKLAA